MITTKNLWRFYKAKVEMEKIDLSKMERTIKNLVQKGKLNNLTTYGT